MTRVGALLAALLLAAPAGAAANAPRFVSFTFENDFFAGYDRHYTNGLQAAWLVGRDELPGALRSAPPIRWSADPFIVVAVGQRIYTPGETESRVPDPRDRPYAGWLYLLADVRTRSGSTIDYVSFGVGVVGPASGARETQDLAHAGLGVDRARGWDAQLRNEPTLMFGFERTWTGVARTRLYGRELDVALRAGATLGNALTYANAGAIVRWGRNLPDDVPAAHITLGPSRDGFRGHPAGFGWYGWLGVDTRAVGRNLFIQGNTWRDGPGVGLERFGYDYQAGITLAWPQARVAFTFVQRSEEFEGQDKPDRFGQLAVSFAY